MMAGRAPIISVSVWAAAAAAGRRVADTVEARVAKAGGGPVLQGAVEPAIEAVYGAEDIDALASAVAGLPAAIAAAARPRPRPAIGPGGRAGDDVMRPVAPERAARLLLRLAGDVGALTVDVPAEAVVHLGAVAAILAAALETVAAIDFESRQHALSWRDRLDQALATARQDAGGHAGHAPAAAGALIGAIATARAELARDINEAIGRLPAVRVFEPPAPVTAWAVAQHFAGDDPSAVIAMLHDIVRRNRLRHPAIAGAPLEVLV